MSNQSYDVKAGLQNIDAFDVCGLSIITRQATAAEDINALWEHFFKQQIGQTLQNHKTEEIIYAVYSDYKGDHEAPYRITIGYKVESADALPETLHTVTTEKADYAMMTAGGQQPKALIETWQAIWQSDLDRRYQTDFEIYGPRFFEEGVHEVIVCIGVNANDTAA